MSDSHGTSGDEVDIHGLFGQVMKTIGEDDFSNNINYMSWKGTFLEINKLHKTTTCSPRV